MTNQTTPFLNALELWLGELDGYVKKRLPVVKDGVDPISCHGCTNENPGCCHHKVMVSFYEALPIARHLKVEELDTPEFREVLRRVGAAMEGTARRPWFHGATPCVFLKDNRCSIYPVRPIACRTYYVIDDRAKCQTDRHERIHSLDVGDIFAESFRRARDVHRAMGLKETPMRILMGTLPRMLLLALESWDSPDGAAHIRAQTWPTADNIEAWLDGANPFGANR